MFTLRFPFDLPPGREISVTEESTSVGDLSFALKREDRFYVLTISGFPSEEEGERYINNVWAGLMWLLLYREISSNAKLEPQKVAYAEDPYEVASNLSKSFGLKIEDPVDALIDGERPAVYPSEKSIRIITGHPATTVITTPANDVLKFMSEGVSFPKSAIVIEDPKLRVALELYGAYFNEFSANARFLTLVMALEALASNVTRTPLVIELLDKWKKEVEELIQTVDNHSDDAASLEAVSRELIFRKEDSIRRQIRNVVLSTLADHGDQDAEQAAQNAVKIYDLRSTLVHDGILESQVLRTATSDAKEIVERVLRARFVQEAK
jgi:hypothetical protein